MIVEKTNCLYFSKRIIRQYAFLLKEKVEIDPALKEKYKTLRKLYVKINLYTQSSIHC